MREPGFYWVKLCGKWEIAKWRGTVWFLTASQYPVYNGMLDEIDERRIERAEP